MAWTCRFTLVNSSTTSLRAASAFSALCAKADFSVAQSARSLLKPSLSFSIALKALVSSSFALEVSSCCDLRFSYRSAVWYSLLLSSACIEIVIWWNDSTNLKYQPHNKICPWYLGANAYLLFIVQFLQSPKLNTSIQLGTWGLTAIYSKSTDTEIFFYKVSVYLYKVKPALGGYVSEVHMNWGSH